MKILLGTGLLSIAVPASIIPIVSCSNSKSNENTSPRIPYNCENIEITPSPQLQVFKNHVKQDLYCRFEYNDLNNPANPLNKSSFFILEDTQKQEIFLSFCGWTNYNDNLEQAENWDGKLPDQLQIPDNVKVTYKGKQYTKLPIKAIGICRFPKITNKIIDSIDNDYNEGLGYTGMYVPQNFDLSSNKNIEYCFSWKIIFVCSTEPTKDDIFRITFPSSLKYYDSSWFEIYNKQTYQSPTTFEYNMIIDLSQTKIESIGSKSKYFNLYTKNAEIILPKTTFQISNDIECSIYGYDKINLKINLENILYLKEEFIFTNINFIPNNTIKVNPDLKYYANAFSPNVKFEPYKPTKNMLKANQNWE